MMALVVMAVAALVLQSPHSFADDGTLAVAAKKAVPLAASLADTTEIVSAKPTIDTVILTADGTLLVWAPEAANADH